MKVATIVLGAAAAVVLSAGAATATWMVVDGGDETTETGQCAAAAYSLEAEREDGMLEISYELQTDAPGQTWQVEIAHEGEPLISGERQTDGDAEIDVDVNAPRDAEGEFTATATPQDGGEPCTARLTVG